MSTPSGLIEAAFQRLSQREGFLERTSQVQLALLLHDLIEGETTGLFEAPTGLGKSLATLIPAIAHAACEGKRTVIATYTNVLAEQYWRNDLPLALSLFQDLIQEDAMPRCQFLIGRQRYACLASMEEHAPDLIHGFQSSAELGIETEFRNFVRKPQRETARLWQAISTPPVCPGRLCHRYSDCFYYKARRAAEKAEIVITNHSVVLQDGLLARATEGERTLLGDYDFLILDEAHDFPQAALNGLEFELSASKLNMVIAMAARLEKQLTPLTQRTGDRSSWMNAFQDFKTAVEQCQKELVAYSLELGQPGIFDVSPAEVLDHPQVQRHRSLDRMPQAEHFVAEFVEEASCFVGHAEDMVERWRLEGGIPVSEASEAVRTYAAYIREYAEGCRQLFRPQGVAVSYAGRNFQEAILRQDVIGLAGPLQEIVWNNRPWACLSATLALDGDFEYFRRTTGAEPAFEEILPSPFDFGSQAALYIPKSGLIPDPSTARKEGSEEEYFRAIARELSEIIRTVGGRTLALFHSRREMEAVRQYVDLPDDLPIYMQMRTAAGAVGDQFKANCRSSLFALRSFWTGFDAPGETLSCVVLVRVPFEVPIEPPQITRLAWMQSQGLDAFSSHTLAQAKMLMRQGAGRLIRRDTDRGLIAILDPRIRTKRYGETILANLPDAMRTYDSVEDAVGWIGLDPALI